MNDRSFVRKPAGLWIAQGYLIALTALTAVSVPSLAHMSWRSILTLAILLAGTCSLQVRARWAYAVTFALFCAISALAALVFVTGTAPTSESADYRIGASIGRFFSAAFPMATLVYVVFSRRSRAYFGVTRRQVDSSARGGVV